MEPLSAGASVLSFLGLALRSAKAIHEVLSTVKDGPKNVQRLADEVAQLQSILERLSQIQTTPIDDTASTNLRSLVSKCVADITAFESKLQHLSLSADDRRIGRLWRRLKAVVSEKDLERMRDVVRAYMLALNVSLSLLHTAKLSWSTAQSSEILDLLKQLKSDVARLCKPSAWTDNGTAALQNPDAITMEDLGDDEQLTQVIDVAVEESIARLMRLIEKKECTIESDDAEQLIHDLRALLESAQKKESSAIQSQMPTDSHEYQDRMMASNVLKELELTYSLILSAPSIAVNSRAAASLSSSVPSGTIIDQQRKRKTIDIGYGTLTLFTNKRRRKCVSEVCQQRDDGINARGERGRDFVAKVIFKPRASQSMLTVSISQAQILCGSFSSIPKLSVNNIRPRDSLVFELAARGSVEDLKLLFAGGKANVHDHDPNNWSLLHFAVHGENTSICRFLIESGLDVDEIAQRERDHRIPDTIVERTPLHITTYTLHSETAALLLEAGADPTLDVRHLVSPLHCLVSYNEFSDNCILRKIFLKSTQFGLASPRDHLGRTALLIACEVSEFANGDFDSRQTIRKLALLLNKGSSLSDTDNNGLTCLHMFFSSLVRPLLEENWTEPLIFLISQGADVYATDYYGRSVSHIAYSESCWDRYKGLGTYRGDLWDAVLDACNYDISKFRSEYPRKEQYGENYSRQDFELLWKGREHRCPYLGDVEWLGPDENSWSQNQGSSREFICICLGSSCDFYGDSNSEVETDSEIDGSSSQDGCSDGDSENETYRDGVQRYCSPVGEDYRASHSLDESSSVQNRAAERTHPQMEEQGSRNEILSPITSRKAGYDMEWNGADMGISDHRTFFQYNVDTLEHEELFHSPWRDDQL